MNINATKTIFSLFILSIIALSSFAQDTIYRKSGEVMTVSIIEVQSKEVKYRQIGETDGPLYSIDKLVIKKIIYKNGREEVFLDRLRDPEIYADQKKHAIKINFLAPLLGSTQISYERNLRPGRGMEFSFGIIGLGQNQNLTSFSNGNEKVSARGALGSFGYKFIKMPNLVNDDSRFWHIMNGSYAAPTVYLGSYSRNFSNNEFNNETIDRTTITFGGLMLNLGKQWVLGDSFLIDLYGGIGYVFDSSNNDDIDGGYHYALVNAGDSGLGFSGGLRAGILLK